jgi:hypothetical protein
MSKHIAQRQAQRTRILMAERFLQVRVSDADRDHVAGDGDELGLAHTGLIDLARQTQAQIGYTSSESGVGGAVLLAEATLHSFVGSVARSLDCSVASCAK